MPAFVGSHHQIRVRRLIAAAEPPVDEILHRRAELKKA